MIGKLRVSAVSTFILFHDIEEYRKTFSVVFSGSLRSKKQHFLQQTCTAG